MQLRHIAAACAFISFSAHAQTVIDNANGYTLNAAGVLVRFQSLAFDAKGRIVAVGSAGDVAAKTAGFRHVDVQGKTVLPGLIDAHMHVESGMLTPAGFAAAVIPPSAAIAWITVFGICSVSEVIANTSSSG